MQNYETIATDTDRKICPWGVPYGLPGASHFAYSHFAYFPFHLFPFHLHFIPMAISPTQKIWPIPILPTWNIRPIPISPTVKKL